MLRELERLVDQDTEVGCAVYLLQDGIVKLVELGEGIFHQRGLGPGLKCCHLQSLPVCGHSGMLQCTGPLRRRYHISAAC